MFLSRRHHRLLARMSSSSPQQPGAGSAPSRSVAGAVGLSSWAAATSASKSLGAPSAASLLNSARGLQKTAPGAISMRTYSTAPTERMKEDVLARYADKLKKKADEQGLKSVADLREAYTDQIEQLKKDQAVPDSVKLPEREPLPASSSSSDASPDRTGAAQAAQAKSAAHPTVPTLEKYLNLDKIRELPAEEIGQLWRLRHASDKTSVAAVIPADTWAHMLVQARKHPQFVLPLPKEIQAEGAGGVAKETGAELHFLQWTFPDRLRTSILLTHLAEFKIRGEFSTPHTTLTVHADLLESHGIVLLHGNVMTDRSVVVDDAKFLLWGVQTFYGPMAKDKPNREKLLNAFTSGDGSGFDVQLLMDEVEKMG